ncbi:hypothetical protein B0H13DRAFT_2110648 [Mycena leptocephala]|nr:hypothetical protein B0H13DRAFT_2110648 [Mycena leptocephala]
MKFPAANAAFTPDGERNIRPRSPCRCARPLPAPADGDRRGSLRRAAAAARRLTPSVGLFGLGEELTAVRLGAAAGAGVSTHTDTGSGSGESIAATPGAIGIYCWATFGGASSVINDPFPLPGRGLVYDRRTVKFRICIPCYSRTLDTNRHRLSLSTTRFFSSGSSFFPRPHICI